MTKQLNKTKKQLSGELSHLSSLYDNSVLAMRLFGSRDYRLGIVPSLDFLVQLGPILTAEYNRGWYSAQAIAGEATKIKK